MSTDLAGFRVLELDPANRRVRFRTFCVYYDTYQGKTTGWLPHNPGFYLMCLWDHADIRFGGGGPLGALMSTDDVCSPAWVAANAWRFIDRVEVLQRRNDPPTSLPDFHYERDGTFGSDESKLLQEDVDVFVTDARWFQHLSLGESWGSTAYEVPTDTVLDRARADLFPELRIAVQVHEPWPSSSDDVDDGEPIMVVAVSDDGTRAAANSDNGDLVVYDLERGTELLRRKFGLGDGLPELMSGFLADTHLIATESGGTLDVDSGVEGPARPVTSKPCPLRAELGPDRTITIRDDVGGVVRINKLEDDVYEVATTPDLKTAVSSRTNMRQKGDRSRRHHTHPSYLVVHRQGAAWPHTPDTSNTDPAPTSTLDHAFMRSMARGNVVDRATFASKARQHALWHASGGGGEYAEWQTLDVSGLALAVFQGASGSEGAQLSVRSSNLVDVDAAGLDLAFSDLVGVVAESVDFSNSTLDGSCAVDAFFAAARFDHASLRKVDFSRSDLRGASFIGADLRGADFENADLSCANFAGAILFGVKLKGAKLDDVTNLTFTAWAKSEIPEAKPVKKKPVKKKPVAKKKPAKKQKKATAKKKPAKKAAKKATKKQTKKKTKKKSSSSSKR